MQFKKWSENILEQQTFDGFTKLSGMIFVHAIILLNSCKLLQAIIHVSWMTREIWINDTGYLCRLIFSMMTLTMVSDFFPNTFTLRFVRFAPYVNSTNTPNQSHSFNILLNFESRDIPYNYWIAWTGCITFRKLCLNQTYPRTKPFITLENVSILKQLKIASASFHIHVYN